MTLGWRRRCCAGGHRGGFRRRRRLPPRERGRPARSLFLHTGCGSPPLPSTARGTCRCGVLFHQAEGENRRPFRWTEGRAEWLGCAKPWGGRDARAPGGRQRVGDVVHFVALDGPLSSLFQPLGVPGGFIFYPLNRYCSALGENLFPLPDLWRIPLEPSPTPLWPFVVLRGPSWISFFEPSCPSWMPFMDSPSVVPGMATGPDPSEVSLLRPP